MATSPGLTRAAAATRLGGRRTVALGLVADAIEAELVHEDQTVVPTRGGAVRAARGLYPGRPRAAEALMPPPATSGSALRAWRAQARVSLAGLADGLGVTRALVHLWETGRQPVPSWANERLGDALEAAQMAPRPRRRRDARRARDVLATVRSRPGITRRELVGHSVRAAAALERALTAGKVHEAPIRPAGRRRALVGLFPGARPRVPLYEPPTGGAFRDARSAAGWTVARAARAIGEGVTPAQLATWERRGDQPLPGWTGAHVRPILEDMADSAGQLERSLLAAMPATREHLTRGTFGRASVVTDALDRLLRSGRAHLGRELVTNAAGVEREIRVLRAGAGAAAETEAVSGQELELARLAAGLSQKALAERAGLARVTIGHYESGRQSIPPGRGEHLLALCAVPSAAGPRAKPPRFTDAELDDQALTLIAAAGSEGLPPRQVAAAMRGDVRRRRERLEALERAGLVQPCEVRQRYSDGRVFTRRHLVLAEHRPGAAEMRAGPLADEPGAVAP